MEGGQYDKIVRVLLRGEFHFRGSEGGFALIFAVLSILVGSGLFITTGFVSNCAGGFWEVDFRIAHDEHFPRGDSFSPLFLGGGIFFHTKQNQSHRCFR